MKDWWLIRSTKYLYQAMMIYVPVSRTPNIAVSDSCDILQLRLQGEISYSLLSLCLFHFVLYNIRFSFHALCSWRILLIAGNRVLFDSTGVLDTSDLTTHRRFVQFSSMRSCYRLCILLMHNMDFKFGLRFKTCAYFLLDYRWRILERQDPNHKEFRLSPSDLKD